MDIEKLIGLVIEDLGGNVVGEIIGVTVFGAKIQIVVDDGSLFEDGGPDDDGGEPVEVPTETSDDQQRFNFPDAVKSNLRLVGSK